MIDVDYLRREFELAELVECRTPGCPNEVESPRLFCEACIRARRNRRRRERRCDS